MTEETTNYHWVLPSPGGSATTWGDELNAAFEAVDGEVFGKLDLGGGNLTGALVLAAGTVGAPAMTFDTDLDCGFYRIGANNIGLALNGAKVVDFATTGVAFTPKVTVPAATLTGAGLNVGQGTTPTSGFANGDLWITSTGLFARVAGATVGPYSTGGGDMFKSDNLSGLSNYTTARSNLGLGSSATVDTGTTGAKIPLLNGNNTYSGTAAFSSSLSIAGAFTANGAVTLGDASGDSLTINPNAVTWSNNPTHSGNHTFSGNVVLNGNVTLGNASGDVITVGGTISGNQFPKAWAECTLVAGSITAQSGLNATLAAAYLDASTGTGKFSCSFTNALPSAAYAVMITIQRSSGGGDVASAGYWNRTTGGFNIYVETNGGSALSTITSISVVVFGPFA